MLEENGRLCYKGFVRTLFAVLMLVSVFIIAFINRQWLGLPLYYAQFPLLALWAYLFWYFSYAVSEKKVRRVKKEPFDLSYQAGMVPASGSGSVQQGRLVITKDAIEFYTLSREEDTPCARFWWISSDKLASFSVGTVLGRARGITFTTKKGNYAFTARKADKEAITHALGWDKAPGRNAESPSTAGEAASAPGFDEALRKSRKESEDSRHT